MNPGTTVKVADGAFRTRTGVVVEPLPMDANWPGFVRVRIDDASIDPLLLDVDNLEAFNRAGQLGLFGGAP